MLSSSGKRLDVRSIVDIDTPRRYDSLSRCAAKDVVVVASLLYSAQIYKGLGDAAKDQAQAERLRQKTGEIADANKPLPQWLLDETRAEVDSRSRPDI